MRQAREKSFLKINQQGVILSDTEKWLINARYCPNSIAARAISLKGSGGAYWQRFASGENKQKISELSASVHSLLFTCGPGRWGIKDRRPSGRQLHLMRQMRLILFYNLLTLQMMCQLGPQPIAQMPRS